MRNIILLGGESLAPYARALEAAGFQASRRAPGAEDVDEGADLVLLELSSAGEDAATKQLLEGAKSGASPTVLVIIDEERLRRFDPDTTPNDFIAVGASAEEVCARVHQALWRRHGVDARNVLQCGDLEMDLANYTVHVSGRPIELTYKEYELLRFLATNRDRVFTRETLLSKVWGYDFYGGACTVDVHIRLLRAKLEEHHRPFIETVRNVGYRFRA